MFSALLYLQFVSLKNRLEMRVRRLKRPKYLGGAIVGLLYFYLYFYRWIFNMNLRHRSDAPPFFETDPALSLSAGALILLLIVLLAWLLPRKRAALTFTEAEIAFLFPAPVTRRTLIHFKLLKSQFSIFLMTMVFTLLFRRTGGHLWIRALGWWLLLMTLNLHFIGSSFAVTALMDRGITTWKRRGLILGLVILLAAVVAGWAVKALPPLTDTDLSNLGAILDYARQVLVSGPLPYLLSPFQLMVRPYQAANGMQFLNALWPALMVLGVHYWWVVRSEVAFEEASIEASKRLADRVAAVRSGKSPFAAGQKLKGRRPPFVLGPSGAKPVALLWKNLLAAGQGFSRRIWFVLLWLTIVMVFVSRGILGRDSNWMPVAGAVAAMIGVWIILIGPQIIRHDLRQDLPMTDLLKLYPMRGWQVVLGEILAPAVILTGVQWLLLILAVGLLSQSHEKELAGGLVFAIGIAAAFLLPLLNVISLLIPNAAVLLFPGWFQTGKDAPAGIEATGQRLIFVLGQILALAVSLAPAAAVFTGIFLLIKFATDVILVAIPIAGLAAAVVLAVEAALGMMWLGWLFERFDVSAEAGA